MPATHEDLHKLDELLTLIERCSPADEAAFALEHVHEARTCLLGAMPNEFGLSLKLARESLARMDETEARRRAESIVASFSKD